MKSHSISKLQWSGLKLLVTLLHDIFNTFIHASASRGVNTHLTEVVLGESI
jgi:hypothetical protein